MEYIDITFKGIKNDRPIEPSDFDISELIKLLNYLDDLLYPEFKSGARPIISYEVIKSSIKNRIRTSLSGVAFLSQTLRAIILTNSINNIDKKTAKSIEYLQKFSVHNEYEVIIETSLNESPVLKITPATKFEIKPEIWVNTEMFVYGQIISIGGKTKSNLHIDTVEHGILTVGSKKDVLKGINKLYETVGLEISTKMNLYTGELDREAINLIRVIEYKPDFDQEQLTKLINQASPNWESIGDIDQWLYKLRHDESID